MTDLNAGLSEENAHKVLARALELQAQSAGALTVAQIREIASELSIPDSAVDQALSEYRATAAFVPRPGATAAPDSGGRQRPAHRVVMSLALVGGVVVLLTVLLMIMRLFPPS